MIRKLVKMIKSLSGPYPIDYVYGPCWAWVGDRVVFLKSSCAELMDFRTLYIFQLVDVEIAVQDRMWSPSIHQLELTIYPIPNYLHPRKCCCIPLIFTYLIELDHRIKGQLFI